MSKDCLVPVEALMRVSPPAVFPGRAIIVDLSARYPRRGVKPKRYLSTNGGMIKRWEPSKYLTRFQIDTTGLKPDFYTLTGHVSYGPSPSEMADVSGNFTILETPENLRVDGRVDGRVIYLESQLAEARESLKKAEEERDARWIPCEERMPEIMEPVLLEGGMALCDGKTWYSMTNHGLAIEWPVTHWMPLPAPPKAVESEGEKP